MCLIRLLPMCWSAVNCFITMLFLKQRARVFWLAILTRQCAWPGFRERCLKKNGRVWPSLLHRRRSISRVRRTKAVCLRLYPCWLSKKVLSRTLFWPRYWLRSLVSLGRIFCSLLLIRIYRMPCGRRWGWLLVAFWWLTCCKLCWLMARIFWWRCWGSGLRLMSF